MKTALFVAAIVSSSPAIAAEDLKEAILSCWTPPVSGMFGDGRYAATFDVVIGKDGFLEDATVDEFTPDTSVGRDAVESFVKAMKRCSPYKVEPGMHRVAFKIDPADTIDPFKGR